MRNETLTIKRWYPEHAAIEIVHNTEFVRFEQSGKPCLLAYGSRAIRPKVRFSFRSVEERETFAARYIEGIVAHEKNLELRKSKRVLAENPVKVEDIFVSSWGYDQTNIDFYKVAEVKGLFITLRELRRQRDYAGRDYGYTMPTDELFDRAEPIRRRVLTYDGGESLYVKLNSFANAYPWDGKRRYESWGR